MIEVLFVLEGVILLMAMCSLAIVQRAWKAAAAGPGIKR